MITKHRRCLYLEYRYEYFNVGLDISVDIAPGYGLDRPGIEFRCWRNFPHSSRPTLGETRPPIYFCLVSPRE